MLSLPMCLMNHARINSKYLPFHAVQPLSPSKVYLPSSRLIFRGSEKETPRDP